MAEDKEPTIQFVWASSMEEGLQKIADFEWERAKELIKEVEPLKTLFEDKPEGGVLFLRLLEMSFKTGFMIGFHTECKGVHTIPLSTEGLRSKH